MPQFMSQPAGLAGCGTVANQVAAAVCRMASARSAVARWGGGGSSVSGSAGS